MMSNQDLVKEFMTAMGQDVEVQDPFSDLYRLRRELIQEETAETATELHNLEYLVSTRQSQATINGAKRRLLKELCDLLYVVYGAGVALNLPLDEAFKEVHRSNMSKLGPDGKPLFDTRGKVLKGPSYKPANLSRFLC